MNVLNSNGRDVHDGLQSMIVQSQKVKEKGDPGSTFLLGRHEHDGGRTIVEHGALLVELIQDLMMEVEALRAAVIRLQNSAQAKEAPYARAYLETAQLTHNSAGPTGGFDKLLDLFYPEVKDSEGRNWREVIMLQRVGFSISEIDRFKQEAKRAELYT